MRKNDGFDFDDWFGALGMQLLDRGVVFNDEDAVRQDYENNRDVHDVVDEIGAEYDDIEAEDLNG